MKTKLPNTVNPSKLLISFKSGSFQDFPSQIPYPTPQLPLLKNLPIQKYRSKIRQDNFCERINFHLYQINLS